jgi:hypothetical protein
MSAQSLTIDDAKLVALQTARPPRTPWRVAARCSFKRPTVIASPSRLDDNTPFPTLFWLTCPHLAEKVAALESAGEAARWARRAAEEPQLAAGLRAADAAVREARAAESGGEDACAAVGLAGQRDPLGVKCLHAHVAVTLVGIADPVGDGVLSAVERECRDDRCGLMAGGAGGSR